MASFGVGDENTLDYEVIRDGGITIYRDFRYLEEDILWLRDKSYRIHRVDCGGWVSENSLHESLKTALAFPDYYGKNFNALNDVISDLDVPDEGGVALVFSSYDFYANGSGALTFWIVGHGLGGDSFGHSVQGHSHFSFDWQAILDDGAIE